MNIKDTTRLPQIFVFFRYLPFRALSVYWSAYFTILFCDWLHLFSG